MAREILFRGKALKTGKFVTGDVSFDPDMERANIRRFVYYENEGELQRDFCEEEVDPETVGQYTGLKDKNGKMVFEGDILKAYYDDEDPETATLSVVEWEQNGWRLKQIGCPAYDDLDDFAIKLNAVVGNIHDNPELLCDKGKEKE